MTFSRHGKPATRGPWEYFQGQALDGAYICIDEIHNFCGTMHSHKVQKQWSAWLGEIRHTGAAAVEFLSQSPHKIGKTLHAEASQTAMLTRSDLRRDPWFRILLGDWYELRAMVTGKYNAGVWREEFMRHGSRNVRQLARVFRFEPAYFELYDSYSRPEGGGGGAATSPPKQEFEERSPAGLVWWFVRRNAWSLFSRLALVFVFIWFVSHPSAVWKTWAGCFRVAPKSAAAQPGGQVKPAAGKRAEPDDGMRSILVNKPAGGFTEGTPEQKEIARLQTELEDLQAVYAKAAAELERSYAVVLITPDEVQFRDGYSYKVGETVDHGPYEGQWIVRVDWERRYAVMSSGVALRMGTPSKSNGGLSVFPSAATGDQAEFSSGLRTPADDAASGRTSWLGPRASANTVSRGNAGSGVSKVRSAQVGDLLRSRVQARRGQRDNRGSQPASVGRPRGGEPTPWGPADKARGSVLPGATPAGG